jgi:hypothetical protein
MNLHQYDTVKLWIRRICMFFGLPDPNPHLFLFVRIRIWILSQQAKKLENLDFYYFSLIDFLSLKTDVHVPSKSKSKKTLKKNLFFVGILSTTDEKSRILIHKSVARIRGSRSVPKCHGSTRPQHCGPYLG